MTSPTSPTPTRVGTRNDWTTIRSRFDHACGLTSDHALWCWGRNEEGQIGQNRSSLSDIPVPTQVTDMRVWVATDAGDDTRANPQRRHALVLGTEHLLGAGPTRRRADPDPVPGAGRGRHRLGGHQRRPERELRPAERPALYCWGANGEDGLPLPNSGDTVEAPTEVPTTSTFVAVAFNTFGGCVRTAAGEALCWGRNVEGQLGLGDTALREVPTALPGGGWTDISPGRFSLCGVRAGVVTCTGDNSEGQLGDGTTNRRNTMGAVALP